MTCCTTRWLSRRAASTRSRSAICCFISSLAPANSRTCHLSRSRALLSAWPTRARCAKLCFRSEMSDCRRDQHTFLGLKRADTNLGGKLLTAHLSAI